MSSPIQIQQLISLLSPTKHQLNVHWPPRAPLTPGTIHHHLKCDRVFGYLVETGCREFIGARGAARGHKQQHSPEPEWGLKLLINTSRPALTRSSPGRLSRSYSGFPDNDLGHGILALHVLADLLAVKDPSKKGLPLFLLAYQDYRKGFAPQQCWRIEHDPYLGAQFLEHIRDDYRYDLLTKSVHLESETTGTAAASAAQAFRAAACTTGVPVRAQASSPSSLFFEASEKSGDRENGDGDADA